MISESLLEAVSLDPEEDGVIVSNARHYEALTGVLEAIQSIDEGFEDQITSDLIAIDIRKALHHLGEITGEITNDELLGNIFSRFCVGK
jgi:tRNA modification GTPase